MAMFRRFVLISLLGWVLSCAWIPAAFATVASASLDWDQFQMEVLAIAGNPAPGWSFISQSTDLSTGAFTFGDSSDSHTHTAFNWAREVEVESLTPGGRGSASATNEVLFAAGSSIPPLVPDDPYWYVQNTGNAQAVRTATLRLDGPAAVVFSAPYSIAANGPLHDFDDYAVARVAGSASYQPDDGYAFQNASRSFELDSRFTLDPALSGPLIFGLVVDGAGMVSVSLEAFASSASRDFVMTPVPEASAVLQMLAGLCVIGGIALRRTLRGSA
jgi:hypothetical protein